jgi:thiamine transport system ATP-binding protein
MATAALSLRDVTFSAGGKEIVYGVSLEVEDGATTAILGPSGCGKTTLLRLVTGIETPDTGSIALNGHDLAGIPTHKRGIGLMFQDFALFPHMDVAGNVAFGLRHAGIPRHRRAPRVRELLTLVGLEGYESRSVENLSGGERQRVALARTLAPNPSVLMLDEPLGSLDRVLRERLLVELREILSRLAIPTIFVTHDQGEAFAIADRVAVMNEGRIVLTGTAQEIFNAPRTEYVARFLGLKAIVPATRSADGGWWETPVGRWPATDGSSHNGQLLLRTEQAKVVGGPGARVVSGKLRSTVFHGATTRVDVDTAAGPMEFELRGQGSLPDEGATVHLHVPEAHALDDSEPP